MERYFDYGVTFIRMCKKIKCPHFLYNKMLHREVNSIPVFLVVYLKLL